MLTHSEEENLNFRVLCVWRGSTPRRTGSFRCIVLQEGKDQEELLFKMSKYENLMGREKENRAVGNAKLKELDPDMSM